MKVSVVTVHPSAPHTHTVVFLHGRGDTARNFAAILVYSRDSHGRSLFEAFPSFRWVFPQAPKRKCANSPETWPQWYDVWNDTDSTDHEELQAAGLKEAVPAIRCLLESEAALVDGRWDRIVLGGISMGGATSLHTLFNLDIPTEAGGKLAALMGFSSQLPFNGRSLTDLRKTLALESVPENDDVLRNTPILLEHCTDDPLVLVRNGRRMRDTLRRELGAQVTWKQYPDGGHWFNAPVGIDDTIAFLKKHVLQTFNMEKGLSNQTQAASQNGKQQ